MNLPDFLVQDRHGYIYLRGHRIGLRSLLDLYNKGYNPEMLHEHFPTLALALIHAVIAFYLENQAEIDEYLHRSRAVLAAQAASPQPGPDGEELRRRMEAQWPKESA
jgi:uncharacterized protein (DUF433 family)